MNDGTLYRLAAFAATPTGGNPVGVWIGDSMPDEQTMRRNVFRAGIAYLVVAWPVLQVADVVFGIIGTPQSVFVAACQ